MTNVTVITQEGIVDDARLAELEAVVGAGMRSFVEVGTALAEIRDSGLYRSGYATFEAYVADKWGWSRNQAYNYVMAAEVSVNAQSIVQLPTMSHALLLTAFSDAQQRRLAPEIATLTVKDARKVVKQFRDKVTGTTPETQAARNEIREVLHEDEPEPVFARWRAATFALVKAIPTMPNDELASLAPMIGGLIATYNTERERRRDSA